MRMDSNWLWQCGFVFVVRVTCTWGPKLSMGASCISKLVAAEGCGCGEYQLAPAFCRWHGQGGQHNGWAKLNHLHRWCGTQGVGRDRQGAFSVVLAFWLGCGQGAHIALMG